MSLITGLKELFEECNMQFPIKGDRRHTISVNPETGTLELGIWIDKEHATFNLDEYMIDNPEKALFFVEKSPNQAFVPPPQAGARLGPPVQE